MPKIGETGRSWKSQELQAKMLGRVWKLEGPGGCRALQGKLALREIGKAKQCLQQSVLVVVLYY